MEPFTLTQAAKYLTDEDAAWQALEAMRWPSGPECPHCHERERVTYLAPRDGARKTRTGKVTHRRLWKCNNCRRQFTALVGTIFEDSRIPVGKWLMAVCLMASAKNGVSAHELHRDLQITYKTAWFMCHRLRTAMSLSPAAEKWTGNTVVSDETWFGGEPKNRHRQGRPSRLPGRYGGTPHHKVPIVSMVNKDTGEVRSTVLHEVTGYTLRKALDEHTDIATTHLQTDSSGPYKSIRKEFASHESVDHSSYEYVRGDVSTNQAEGYFSQLKRSLDGTHHGVSRVHLSRYTGEFDFRYDTCKVSDSERAVTLIRRAQDRRLTYDRLIGRGVRLPLRGRGANPYPPYPWL